MRDLDHSLGDDSPTTHLLDLAEVGRSGPAIDFALGLLTSGLGSEQMILDVLAPTQREVGLLWQSGRWNVGQEHAASTVVDGVLGAMEMYAPVTQTRGSAVVACVEGEYHSLPARMGTERLRLDGWGVTFLGANMPSSDLKSFLIRAQPDVVVLSCTFELCLPGAARSIAALAELGLPAVVAGAGFGDTPSRAMRLGASAWIGPGMDPTPILESLLAPARSAHIVDADSANIELQRADLIADCMTDMFAQISAMSAYDDRQVSRWRADLDSILRHLGVALDVDEPELFDGFIVWLLDVLTHRGVPSHVLAVSLDIVTNVLERAELARPAAICASTRSRIVPD